MRLQPAINFGPAPTRIPLPVVDPPVRRRRVRRAKVVNLTIPLPSRMDATERDEAEENYRLAYGYVQRQGWRFESVIDREDQVAECFVRLCMILDRSKKSGHNPDKARLSTFAYRCFFRHLSSIAAKRGKFVATVFSDLDDFDPEYSEESEDETDAISLTS